MRRTPHTGLEVHLGIGPGPDPKDKETNPRSLFSCPEYHASQHLCLELPECGQVLRTVRATAWSPGSQKGLRSGVTVAFCSERRGGGGGRGQTHNKERRRRSPREDFLKGRTLVCGFEVSFCIWKRFNMGMSCVRCT